MENRHNYTLTVKWTGNTGNGTRSYKEYERDHVIIVKNKPQISGSSDVAFRGDASKHNPEELLVASLSACHMLWYLHLCADAGIKVVSYIDEATGVMTTGEKPGKFQQVTLNPHIEISEFSMIGEATKLHEQAHKLCFIANSVNFPVFILPVIQTT